MKDVRRLFLSCSLARYLNLGCDIEIKIYISIIKITIVDLFDLLTNLFLCFGVFTFMFV